LLELSPESVAPPLLIGSSRNLPTAGIGFVHTGSLGDRERAEHRRGLLALLTRSDI
jgi:hypothetical protein